MLRDYFNTYSPPTYDDLSVDKNHEVNIILDFIDKNILGFHTFYSTHKDSDKENRISDFLVYYFNVCLCGNKEQGFPPFNFGKNPTQAISGKETDIGVVVLTKNAKPITVIEFESKRFSSSSNNKEYVCGERGGMERFKRGLHASHLTICGMFAYVQKSTSLEWIQKINNWISELSRCNQDSSIDWKSENEKLIKLKEFSEIQKWTSNNSRLDMRDIKIYHYFITLN